MTLPLLLMMLDWRCSLEAPASLLATLLPIPDSLSSVEDAEVVDEALVSAIEAAIILDDGGIAMGFVGPLFDDVESVRNLKRKCFGSRHTLYRKWRS